MHSGVEDSKLEERAVLYVWLGGRQDGQRERSWKGRRRTSCVCACMHACTTKWIGWRITSTGSTFLVSIQGWNMVYIHTLCMWVVPLYAMGTLHFVCTSLHEMYKSSLFWPFNECTEEGRGRASQHKPQPSFWAHLLYENISSPNLL